ncbi:phosphoglycerate kinase, partial [Anaerococcus nagyae]|uniref:phosphoglycerate kinase n=1 Tax=Anaerococcus nagyae TaxID=1755241 RepID=UPI00373586E1
VGTSLVEDDYLDYAKEMEAKAAEKGVKFLIPVDTVVAKEFKNDSPSRVAERGDIQPDEMGLDIGPKTRALFADAVKDAKTVVWNGPMGVFEIKEFSNGTNEVAKALAESEATTIVGGGDSALAIEMAGLKDKITHVSTGGGASLEFLEGKDLPGISAIEDK